MNERRMKMHNDNCNCKVPVGGCDVPAPYESMKDVILDLHDKMMKARAMSEDISVKLFGINPTACGDNQIEVNCAHDALCDTRRIANYVLETLYAVLQRIEG